MSDAVVAGFTFSHPLQTHTCAHTHTHTLSMCVQPAAKVPVSARLEWSGGREGGTRGQRQAN